MKIVRIEEIPSDIYLACDVCPDNEKGFASASYAVHLSLFKRFSIWLALCESHYTRFKNSMKGLRRK